MTRIPGFLEEMMRTQHEPNVQIKRSEHPVKRRILIVDDAADLVALTTTILEMHNYETFGALGGREALAILSEIDQPDLILLDMQMEDMSGPDFLALLEEKKPELIKNVPIVFLTAFEKVPMTKASGFIRKPFQIKEFLTSVHHFIEVGIVPHSVKQ